jgi:hypothetical protein
MSYWQLIFLQSKVNRGAHDGDRLPRQNWAWPQQTWFQERLRYIRKTQYVLQRKTRPRLELVAPRHCGYEQNNVAQANSFKEVSNGMPTMLARLRS